MYYRRGKRAAQLKAVRRQVGYMQLKHELWEDKDGLFTFVLSGPMGEEARSQIAPGARMIWEVEANSHFEAMTLYYRRMGWGRYTTEHEWDYQPYPLEWWQKQNPGKEPPK
jgi:hypothetical protein